MSLPSLLAFSLLCLLSFAASAGAADPSPAPRAIWSGLVLATNNSHPAQVPSRLSKFADKLRNIFGYNQFELVGEYSERMDAAYERWLIPSKDFYLSVMTHNAPGERHRTKIVLFQNRHQIAEFETRLNSESPLFIRGPQYAGGQLVMVLRVVDPSEIPSRPPRTSLEIVKPSPIFLATPPREKEKLYPMPPNHFGPMPVDHFGPMPPDRFGASPGPFREGQGPGDFGSKSMRP